MEILLIPLFALVVEGGYKLAEWLTEVWYERQQG